MMTLMEDSTVWFEVESYRTEQERAFVAAIRKRANDWGDLDVWADDSFTQRREDRLILALDLVDRERHSVLRTLRADYDETGVVVGPDPSGQLVGGIDTSRGDAVVHRGGGTPESLADIVADWMENEMRRPIERHEWQRQRLFRRLRFHRYVLADTGESLGSSYPDNRPRSQLGSPNRIVVVRDFRLQGAPIAAGAQHRQLGGTNDD